MNIIFELDSQEFMALNGGPAFKFSEAVSFVIPCKTQSEIDNYWNKLSEGGQEQPCGWLKDKFDLSWQVIPDNMEEFFQSADPGKAERAMKALLVMKKIVVEDLKKA